MEQSRKKFLKHFLIGATSVPLILGACKKEDLASGSDTGQVLKTDREVAVFPLLKRPDLFLLKRLHHW